MNKHIKEYLAAVPLERRKRLLSLRKAFLGSVPGVKETMKYRMPTYEIEPNWVAIANQKNYISIYFCSAVLIEGIKRKYPDLSTGVGCVRIRDNQNTPTTELLVAFRRAMKLKPANQAL